MQAETVEEAKSRKQRIKEAFEEAGCEAKIELGLTQARTRIQPATFYLPLHSPLPCPRLRSQHRLTSVHRASPAGALARPRARALRSVGACLAAG